MGAAEIETQMSDAGRCRRILSPPRRRAVAASNSVSPSGGESGRGMTCPASEGPARTVHRRNHAVPPHRCRFRRTVPQHLQELSPLASAAGPSKRIVLQADPNLPLRPQCVFWGPRDRSRQRAICATGCRSGVRQRCIGFSPSMAACHSAKAARARPSGPNLTAGRLRPARWRNRLLQEGLPRRVPARGPSAPALPVCRAVTAGLLRKPPPAVRLARSVYRRQHAGTGLPAVASLLDCSSPAAQGKR